MSDSKVILKARLKVKDLERQWRVLSGRYDLSVEQRGMRAAVDRDLFMARAELNRLELEEVGDGA